MADGNYFYRLQIEQEIIYGGIDAPDICRRPHLDMRPEAVERRRVALVKAFASIDAPPRKPSPWRNGPERGDENETS